MSAEVYDPDLYDTPNFGHQYVTGLILLIGMIVITTIAACVILPPRLREAAKQREEAQLLYDQRAMVYKERDEQRKAALAQVN